RLSTGPSLGTFPPGPFSKSSVNSTSTANGSSTGLIRTLDDGLPGKAKFYRTLPPLILMTCPVINSAAGDTSQRATLATSSGLPQPRSRDPATARFCQASEAFSPQAVLIQPGAKQFTRTSGARLLARLLVKAMTAPLAAAKS